MIEVFHCIYILTFLPLTELPRAFYSAQYSCLCSLFGSALHFSGARRIHLLGRSHSHKPTAEIIVPGYIYKLFHWLVTLVFLARCSDGMWQQGAPPQQSLSVVTSVWGMAQTTQSRTNYNPQQVGGGPPQQAPQQGFPAAGGMAGPAMPGGMGPGGMGPGGMVPGGMGPGGSPAPPYGGGQPTHPGFHAGGPAQMQKGGYPGQGLAGYGRHHAAAAAYSRQK